MGHFVDGAIAGQDTPRRIVGIGDVVGRVVVRVAHGDSRAAGQEERLGEAEDGLPVEIPARDVDESFGNGAGQAGGGEHIAAEIVGVRVKSEEMDIFGQGEGVFDDKVLVTGRNVERAIVLELQQNGKAGGGLGCEVDADRGLDGFEFAGRLKVSVEDKIVARIEAKRVAGRFDDGSTAWLPKKKVAIRIESFGFDLQFHAGKTAAGRFFVATGRLGTVHEEIGVMDQSLVARMDFNGFDETGRGDGGAENKVPIDVAAAGGNFKGSGRMEDEIGLAELPAGSEMGRRREIVVVSFGSAGVKPFLEQRDFCV